MLVSSTTAYVRTAMQKKTYKHANNKQIQVIASVLARDLSSGSSSAVEGEASAPSQLKDQCAWYGMSYLIDTTLGLFLAISLLGLLDWIANERDWVHLKHSGVYVGPDGYKHWISQVVAWMTILTIVKFIIYLVMRIFSQQLAVLGQWLFEPLQSNIRLELLFVMIVFPGLLNVIYFWIADSYLKAKHEHVDAHEQSPEFQLAEKKEALLQQSDGEHDDISQQQQRHMDAAAAVASSRQSATAASQQQQESTTAPIV
jgi:STIMATE family